METTIDAQKIIRNLAQRIAELEVEKAMLLAQIETVKENEKAQDELQAQINEDLGENKNGNDK